MLRARQHSQSLAYGWNSGVRNVFFLFVIGIKKKKSTARHMTDIMEGRDESNCDGGNC